MQMQEEPAASGGIGGSDEEFWADSPPNGLEEHLDPDLKSPKPTSDEMVDLSSASPALFMEATEEQADDQEGGLDPDQHFDPEDLQVDAMEEAVSAHAAITISPNKVVASSSLSSSQDRQLPLSRRDDNRVATSSRGRHKRPQVVERRSRAQQLGAQAKAKARAFRNAAFGHHNRMGEHGELDDEFDDEVEEDEDDDEHIYHHGLHAVPINSPGEELNGDAEIILEQSRNRLGIRNRVFFQSDDSAMGGRRKRGFGIHLRGNGGSTGSAPGGRIFRRISFRRRKNDAVDKNFGFWIGVMLVNLLSLGVLLLLVAYLAQTDFFTLHQNELLGTTVDNRFTVVSQQSSKAKILLKSGYSNSRYSEAMIAFGSGVLQLGRRALATSDAQSFYGLLLLNNGTASFTNRLVAPIIGTDYLHAGKAVIFEDGTTMTTAANISGGLKQVGDLNIVSTKGDVIASSGGKQRLIVHSDGNVIFPSSTAEDPSAKGITVDGTGLKISFAGKGELLQTQNATSLRSTLPLHLNSSVVVMGDLEATQVSLTCPHQAVNNDADAAEKERVDFVISGQRTDNANGGDIRVNGGDGAQQGGAVHVTGGKATKKNGTESRGDVLINAEEDKSGPIQMTTRIGAPTELSVVKLNGIVQINAASAPNDAVDLVVSGKTHINGSVVAITSQKVQLGDLDSESPTTSVRVASKEIEVGVNSSSVRIGTLDATTVGIHGKKAFVDGQEYVKLGSSATDIWIGSHGTAGQSVEVLAEIIDINATKEVLVNEDNPNAWLRVQGNVQLGVASANASDVVTSVSIESKKVSVGQAAQTQEVLVHGSSIKMGSDAASGDIKITGTDVTLSATNSQTLSAKTMSVNGESKLLIGKKSPLVQIGGNVTKKLMVEADDVVSNSDFSLTGDFKVSGAESSISLTSKTIEIGGNATASLRIGGPSGGANAPIEIGVRDASQITLGSPSSVIDLKGRVVLNGVDLHTRRRLASTEYDSEDKKPCVSSSGQVSFGFGGMNAHQTVLQLDAGNRSEFAFAFHESFASSSQSSAFDLSNGSFVVGAKQAAGVIELSLGLTNVWQSIQRSSLETSSTKLRCRVVRSRPSTKPAIVLEAASFIESRVVGDTIDDEEDDAISLGLSATRLVSFQASDTFSMSCTVASRTWPVHLRIGETQLAFIEL